MALSTSSRAGFGRDSSIVAASFPRHGRRQVSLWALLPLFFVAVLLSHWSLLRLPYFWDEGGYYVPAAWDLFKTGTLIPQTTATNAHPPLPMILMAGWWKLFGFHILATRTLVCLVSATALLGVFRMSRELLSAKGAAAATLLTAVYPIWFAQSTLAHADIFAAACTLWGLAIYFERDGSDLDSTGLIGPSSCFDRRQLLTGLLLSLAALSKETAIVTPLTLASLNVFLAIRSKTMAARGACWLWAAALIAPILPLAAWYAYHRAKTGFIFGNPEFLRYNATANLDAHRMLLCLWHRFIHLTLHMNMYVLVCSTLAVILMPVAHGRRAVARPALVALLVVLSANLIEFSILGGALLTRYLLPMYPLVILICISVWEHRLPAARWRWLAALSSTAFLAGIWINPPYAFAPEDNLTYRDMIVLHQRAIALLEAHYPQATVLTAWPATAEISRPELGYTTAPFKFVQLENFSIQQMQRAAAEPEAYDTALLFSTKWAPPASSISLSRGNESADAKYFDFHLDLRPEEAAALLHGEVVWKAARGGEWAALLRFPRIVDARLGPLKSRLDSLR